MIAPSYHDLYITTPLFDRTSIFDLPYSILVRCCRTTGWEVWESYGGLTDKIERLIAGEYAGPEKWIVLDVNGGIIVDSRNTKWD